MIFKHLVKDKLLLFVYLRVWVSMVGGLSVPLEGRDIVLLHVLPRFVHERVIVLRRRILLQRR